MVLLISSTLKHIRPVKALNVVNIQKAKYKHVQWRCYSNKVDTLVEKSCDPKRSLSLAPMMEYTDRHYRHMIRILSRSTILYTEMVTANAIVHQHNLASKEGDEDALRRIKRFVAQSKASPLEDPCVLQLGGADRELLYNAARIVHSEYADTCNYTAMNLNCGCPSSKVVSSGCFGAALMHEPILVRDITRAMSEGCNHQTPVSNKFKQILRIKLKSKL